MDSKKVAIIAGVTAGVLIAGYGIYYIFSGDEEDETVNSTSKPQKTFEELLVEIKAEAEKLKNVEKMSEGKMNEDYIVNVFYILTKYVAVLKTLDNNELFEKRIEALKNEQHAEYRKLRVEHDALESKRMTEIQNTILGEFGITELEYTQGYQNSLTSPSFTQKMQAKQTEVVQEVQSMNPDEELSEDLTKEVAIEIRDFAKKLTQETIYKLQATITDQQRFQEEFMFEISKLDDIIYVKYGFKNTEVLKAFKKYNLVPQAGAPMSQMG